jgi:hypothetical protein
MIYATLCLHCEQLLTRVMHCTNGCRQLQVGSHLVIDIAVIVKRRVVHDCCDCSPVAPVGCMRERLVPKKKKKKKKKKRVKPPSCMDPPLQYKLSNTCQHARTPQWLLRMLHNQHGTLYDPCPHSPSSDGLCTPWSSSKVNFVNPPFADAKHWLLKAAEEARKHKHCIVLVPFRPHTQYMSVHAVQHAVSVCVLSKPIRFEDPYGIPFSRPLPTPVCLVSFGADLTPHPFIHIPNTAVARLDTDTASSSVESVAEHVEHCTAGECGIIHSPIAGAARDAVAQQKQTAVLCPAHVTNNEVQQHLMRSACAVVFVSPAVKPTNETSNKHSSD